MVHGISGYFLERARAARRMSLLTLALSAGLLSALLLTRSPLLRPAAQRLLDSARFGYEGPERYVRRIQLEQVERHTPPLVDVGGVQVRSSLRGGADSRRGAEGVFTPRARFPGPGEADASLPLRTLARLANVPVIQSEELIIDRLVRPQYPAPLLDKNIEGKVMLQALIDTLGQVVEIQVLGGTGEPLFERAAEEAVWQCRFRPYRREGEVSEVYAVFRFAFRIY